jgi:hypothetical protein
MCMNCVTNLDALCINAVGAAIVATNVWERVSDRRQGISRLEREQRTYIRNASFMRELGLEPIDILGPPPGHIPVAEPVAQPAAELVSTGALPDTVLA